MNALLIALVVSSLHLPISNNTIYTPISDNENLKTEIITPNHISLNTSQFIDKNNNYIMYTENENSGRNFIGLYKIETKKISLNEEASIRVKTERIAYDGKHETNVALMSLKSLKPRYIIQKDKHALTFIQYSLTGIEGEIVIDSFNASFHDNAQVPVFDENATDLIVQALPLEKGYKASFWTYSNGKDNPVDFKKLEVLEETQTKTGNGQFAVVYLVQVTGGNQTLTYSILKSDKSIIKKTEKNKSGEVVYMELL